MESSTWYRRPDLTNINVAPKTWWNMSSGFLNGIFLFWLAVGLLQAAVVVSFAAYRNRHGSFYAKTK